MFYLCRAKVGGNSSVVEHHLAKVRVAGPNPVFRSMMSGAVLRWQALFFYHMGSSGGMVDTGDLKSPEQQCSCGFDSHLEYDKAARVRAAFFMMIY